MIASTTRRVCRRIMSWSFSALSCTFALLMAGPAGAGPIATISGSVDEFLPTDVLLDDFDRTIVGSTSNALGPKVDVLAYGHADYFAYAAAGNGGVHAHSNVFFDFTQPQRLGDELAFRTSADASLTIDDFVVNGPAGTKVTTALHFHLTGLVQAGSSVPYSNSIFNGGKPQTNGGAIINVGADFFGSPIMQGVQELTSVNGSSPTSSGIGVLANFTGNDVLTTDPFTVTANTLFSLRFELGVVAGAGLTDGGAGNASGSADFSNTLTFVDDRPVFDLPLGYTANSLEAGIVDNRFGAPDVPASVPEPATFLQFAVGLTGLLTAAGWRRFRSRIVNVN